jgi:hypothetical protein
MPGEDNVAEFFTEVVMQLEASNGRLTANEKATDELRRVLGDNTKVAENAVRALERIAKADEERVATEKEATAQRGRWFDKLWASQPAQMLLIGFVIVVLNTFGAGAVSRYLPALQPSPGGPDVVDDVPPTP